MTPAADGHAVTILCSCEATERRGFVIYRCRQKGPVEGEDLKGALVSVLLQLLNNAHLQTARGRIMKCKLKKKNGARTVFRNKCVKHSPVVRSITECESV